MAACYQTNGSQRVREATETGEIEQNRSPYPLLQEQELANGLIHNHDMKLFKKIIFLADVCAAGLKE